MTTIRIELPWDRPPLTGNDRGHTRFRSPLVKQTLAEARRAVFACDLTPIVGADVTLHWRIPTRGRRDSDNLGPTLKECLDALVLERVLPDDSWVHVPRSGCEIHPPTGEPAAMWIELTDITHFDAEQTACRSCGRSIDLEPTSGGRCDDCRNDINRETP